MSFCRITGITLCVWTALALAACADDSKSDSGSAGASGVGGSAGSEESVAGAGEEGGDGSGGEQSGDGGTEATTGGEVGTGGAGEGGSEPVAGSPPSQGGALSEGGETSEGGSEPVAGSAPSQGGAPSEGGETSEGGSEPVAGSAPSQGGAPSEGGETSEGGSEPVAGSAPSQGGAPSEGGETSEGGSEPVAGSPPSQGGAPSEGGSDAGGNQGTAGSPAAPTDTIIDHRSTDAGVIPEDAIEQAVSNLHIAYWHTSHGSQVVSGMQALAAYEPYDGRFAFSVDGAQGLHFSHDVGDYDQPCPELSHCSDNQAMLGDTRRILGENPEVNVVMWAWCSINGHDIDRYLANMETLIAEFGPGGTDERAATTPVEFIFMTGHSEGGSAVPQDAAAQIRAHCEQNNRWLVDYFDIEAHDIAGNSYADRGIADNLAYDGGNWAVEYLTGEDPDAELVALTDLAEGCAHSDSPTEAKLNCVLKGQAAWWVFSRIAGWDPE